MGNRILRDAGLPHELVVSDDLARLTPAELANAIELKHILKEPLPEDLNPEMLRRYPELKAIVPVKSRRAESVSG